jgi:ATPase subunit of ABC transporter with duplicated ATPase domains
MSRQSSRIAIMGPTCAGKSTFLNFAIENDPGRVGLVEVGKMLRAKVPALILRGPSCPGKDSEGSVGDV